MATFEVQVEGLTSLALSGSSDPTQDELSQFLHDGVLDVTNRWLTIKPQDRSDFMQVTGLQVAQGVNLDAADIISVLRADGVTSGNFRPCRKISQDQEHLVTDKESFQYASKYNPAFMQYVDGTVHVFPAPSDNSGKDSYKIYYVNNTPVDGSGTSLTYADSTLGYFPADKIYLVILYASMRTLHAKMGATTIGANEPGAFSLTAVPPDSISDSITAFSLGGEFDDAMAKAKALIDTATVGGDTEPETAQFWLADEDAEMVGATIGVAAQELQRANLGLQDALSTFNSDVQQYQQEGIGKYNAEVQLYQAEVNAEVQEYASKIQRYAQNIQDDSIEYQWLQDQYTRLKAEYDQAFAVAAPKPQGQGR